MGIEQILLQKRETEHYHCLYPDAAGKILRQGRETSGKIPVHLSIPLLLQEDQETAELLYFQKWSERISEEPQTASGGWRAGIFFGRCRDAGCNDM